MLAIVTADGALVNVGARKAINLQPEALPARALEGTFRVAAFLVARALFSTTEPRTGTLVDVLAANLAAVWRVFEAFVANAAVRTHRVNTAAVDAHALHGQAFVHVFAIVVETDSVGTQLAVVSRSFSRASFAAVSPRHAHSATTSCSRDRSRCPSRRTLSSSDDALKAISDSNVQTFFAISARFVAIVAVTSVAPFGVGAASVLARTRVTPAFVHISALVAHGPDLFVSRGTHAHVIADQVFAGVSALPGQARSALVQILAVFPVQGQFESVRAGALEGTGNVLTTESAHVTHFPALVDVLAGFLGSRGVPGGTGTFEAAVDVATGAVVAAYERFAAFVHVNTVFSVKLEARSTLATIGSVRIDALAVRT